MHGDINFIQRLTRGWRILEDVASKPRQHRWSWFSTKSPFEWCFVLHRGRWKSEIGSRCYWKSSRRENKLDDKSRIRRRQLRRCLLSSIAMKIPAFDVEFEDFWRKMFSMFPKKVKKLEKLMPHKEKRRESKFCQKYHENILECKQLAINNFHRVGHLKKRVEKAKNEEREH